ncbi:MAG TPA: hypothetical protein VMI35_10490, partial [Puia sp.]|nr:hypothetical protein [Puia sp.]
LAAIARTYLSTTRNYILLTGDDKADADFSTLSSMAGQAFEYYIGKLKHNDWRQIGNLTFIISLARDVALLGGSGDDLYVGYMSRIKNILDGFTLSVEMDVKFGKGQGYWISHLKGDCKIGPDFERDSNQCYKWIILDENRPDLFGFYRPKLVQEFDCQLITNQITAPMPPVYIGTKKYSITLHGLKMDFCNPGKDTIILSNFYPNPTNAGTWRIPQAGLAYWGVEGDHFFEDTKAKQKLAESGQAQAEMAKYQSQNEQMIAQMKAMAQHMANDTGRKSAADYQQIMQMFNKVRESSNNGVMAKMLSLDFEIPVENNGQVLVDKMFDAREINPQFAAAIVYARYTIHIENKANPQQKPPVNIPAK